MQTHNEHIHQIKNLSFKISIIKLANHHNEDPTKIFYQRMFIKIVFWLVLIIYIELS